MTGVTPGTGPLAGGVDLRRRDVLMGLFVGDQGPGRGAGTVDARLVARLPEHGVPGEEREVHAGIAGRGHVVAHVRRPVLVVARRHEQLVVLDEWTVPVGVDVAEVRHVVPVALEKAHHRHLGGEEAVVVVGVGAAEQRPVVTDLVRRTRECRPRSEVQAVPAVVVVRLPGRVGGLVEDIGVTRVVAHDEDDRRRRAGVAASQECLVHTRHGGAGNVPRGGDRPVPAIDESGCRVREAAGLRLRQRRARRERRDATRAVSAVVPEAEDLNPVVARVRVDLERDGLTEVDAHPRREALDGRTAVLVDVPLRRWTTRQAVLARDLVEHGVARIGGRGRAYRCDREARREEHQRGRDDGHATRGSDRLGGHPSDGRRARVLSQLRPHSVPPAQSGAILRRECEHIGP